MDLIQWWFYPVKTACGRLALKSWPLPANSSPLTLAPSASTLPCRPLCKLNNVIRLPFWTVSVSVSAHSTVWSPDGTLILMKYEPNWCTASLLLPAISWSLAHQTHAPPIISPIGSCLMKWSVSIAWPFAPCPESHVSSSPSTEGGNWMMATLADLNRNGSSWDGQRRVSSDSESLTGLLFKVYWTFKKSLLNRATK